MSEQINGPLTIRIGRHTLAFSMPGNIISYEPFIVKSGISMAANLREALKTINTFPQQARVVIDSSVLVMPIEEFEETNMVQQHRYTFPREEQDLVLYNVLPDLNAVAVFNINKDMKTVLDDHFNSLRFVTLMAPVWRHLHQRSFTGARLKLYGYFHEKRLEVFSFQQNRFRFCNSFDASHVKDSLYFLLYVWQQLQLDAKYDELHLVGDIPERDEMVEELKKYLQKVYIINPSADFNRAPVTEIKGMPYDLQTLYVKGR